MPPLRVVEAVDVFGDVTLDVTLVMPLLDLALANLTLRRPTTTDICSGFSSWAQGFAQVAIEHTIPPVDRIGAIAWFARVALRDEERAA